MELTSSYLNSSENLYAKKFETCLLETSLSQEANKKFKVNLKEIEEKKRSQQQVDRSWHHIHFKENNNIRLIYEVEEDKAISESTKRRRNQRAKM